MESNGVITGNTMPPKDDPELQKLRKELDDMMKKIKEEQDKVADKTLQDICGDMADAPKVRLTTKKLLKGHINKVNSVHFSGDSRHAVTGSLDGKLIIWDTWTGNKVQVIPLRSSWVMSVAFAPSGNYVACGGMDNMCTIYDLNNRDSTGAAKIVRELLGYEGFLSSCRFLDDKTIITGSGDMKICLWDLEAGKRSLEFEAHSGDVVSISLSPDSKTYITGSVDKSCRLWDLRDEKPKQTFFGHTSDVNSVCFHPSGYAFATGSEDKTSRMFDIRSDQNVATYCPPNSTSGFTSCGLSFSGRYVLCGSDDSSVHIWDTLKNQHNGCLTGHENRITSLSVAGNGMAVATCSWDNNVRVWV
ncbi:guanine nucleotide-binding protein subunit beta-2 isoform X2 [Zootermopsis nevadensis]|uniref:guanine nucleotide-binding protein subunit beta-2 isoform X2 n=1 Tax=Zootermopsis nevadensis TaxID=136037 RepID=UPI000B8EE215|nr:guanine nucleotide-binding protein subunit beta-2 isoform X2 [Zootermopsis nevadensis]